DQLRYEPGEQQRVRPDGPIGLVYDKLIDHLGATHEVIAFDYDWRVPIEQEAQRLAAAVTKALDARKASGTPVRLLAHSMGGVLARCLQLEAPQVWERLMAHPDARLLMLGTPNGGSWAPMQVLSGDDTFGNALAAFGSPLADRKARNLMAAMPGFLQLQAGLLDAQLQLDRHSTWAALAKADYDRMQQANWWHRYAGEEMEAAYRWGVPPQDVLDAAKALRQRLDTQRDTVLPAYAGKLLLVVGHAKATPVGFEEGERGFVYLDAGDGDGRVPLDSALLPGVKTWQLDCDHGSLPSAKAAFGAFVELLQSGHTTALAPFALSAATRGAAARDTLVRSRPSRMRKAARPAQSQLSVFGSGEVSEAALATAAGATGVLQLQVLNGNLSFVAEPLLVGHYRASELTGTEAVVDGLVGGTLAAALGAGLYPDEVGTHQVFINTRTDPANPWRAPRPHCVLVVGLGEEGELREAGLAQSVRQGVLGWAQRQAEHQALAEGDTRVTAPQTLAATLLGSGGLGITASAAARAIARGVAEANQRAAAAGWPVVHRLVLVELYLDRATEAVNGLRMLAEAHADLYTLAPHIRSGTGPLRRQLDSGYRGADYDLIRATTGEGGSVEFVLDSRRARTEVRSQRTQTPLLRELVQSAATDRNDDPTVGRTLFQLLVPTEIEPFLGGAERMVLELDPGTAALPWELLDTGSAGEGDDRRPWALRAQLLRRLQKNTRLGKPRDASADHDVLVIGEPLVDDSWAPLPAARDEALAVEAALCGAGGLAPERVIALVDSPDAQTVIGTLLSRPWRMVHVSGHGVAPSEKEAGGVVLSGGHFLGPDEIRAMRTVPELVFVNCCNLAQYEDGQALRPGFDPGRFAAAVADQLIEIGVRCVVACGWPVNDGPAAAFAATFYDRLLGGARFLDAVGAAREACWNAMPEGRSWAAYQCYGDPNWVYRSGTGDAQAPRVARDEFADIASAPALALALETLAVRARFMGGKPDVLAHTLQQLAQRFEAHWGGIGAVAEAFAVAWQNLGERAQAIAWYERAVAAADASASFKAEEQLLNLRARQAWADASAAKGARVKQRAAVTAAVAALQDLAQRRPTMERQNLLGSAYKRLALIERAAGQAAAERLALQQSLAAYRQADALAASVDPGERGYPLANIWALALCLGDAAPGGFDETARAALEAARALKSAHEPDFWSQVAAVEMQMLQALAAGRLAVQADALVEAFDDLHRRHAAARDWSSVADQAALVLAPRATGKGPEAQAAARLLGLLDQHAAAKAGGA
ncbi:MAG: CHAT domain-containing protein, partial [Rubrivivax sp.]|nr:CHAT domain-containing protein [Rubrivivax sp.]